jgi:pSer/pThr/pTyr-binding forkhead associated (FHA) protein
MSVSRTVQYALQWAGDDDSPTQADLADGDITIGRSSDCDIVLPSDAVSRRHARIHVQGDDVEIRDLGSRNGTIVNGKTIDVAPLVPGDQVRIGSTAMLVVRLGETTEETIVSDEAATIVLDPAAVPVNEPPAPYIPAPIAGHVVDDLLAAPILSEQALAARGIDVTTVEYAALGGGQGSFAWVSYLRNSGCQLRDILVVGIDNQPYGRYKRLCENSQIPPRERLRSHSESCPDNIWGFPSYAAREIWKDFTQLKIGQALGTSWQIFGEPAITDTYTPRSGDVFDAMEHEAKRIGWYRVFRRGRIRAIRKSDRGRLLAIVSQSDEAGRRHTAVSARYLHLAIGYPAIRLLEDLAHYREKYGDLSRVVNAYEDHAHVYDELRRHGGTVLIRGRGIVASRIIQRLWEERRFNKNITIVHLHRSRLTAGHRYGLSRRLVENQFEFQPFNWPKGCWTGEQRESLEQASDAERKGLIDIWAGTTTARRSDWRRILRDGIAEGWYRPEFGHVKEVKPTAKGQVLTEITSGLPGGGVLDLTTDYVIDCTGAEAGPDKSPLIADLIRTYNLPLNALGRVKVSNDFEVEGLRHGDARMFASGTTVLGGPNAAVDSFLGLQYAALRSVDAMRRLVPGPTGLRGLNGIYSFWQWTKWARGIEP